jgi:hypothetical protein
MSPLSVNPELRILPGSRDHALSVRPENPKLFTDLTFVAFLLMLDQRTSPSSDTL